MDTVLKISVALIAFFFAVLYLLDVKWPKILKENLITCVILVFFILGCGYFVYQNSLTFLHNRNIENARLGNVGKEVNPNKNLINQIETSLNPTSALLILICLFCIIFVMLRGSLYFSKIERIKRERDRKEKNSISTSCPDCGSFVSTMAYACPKCGRLSKVAASRAKTQGCAMILLIWVLFGIIFNGFIYGFINGFIKGFISGFNNR